MLTARSSGTVSSAPEAALASAPVSSGALRSCMMTAAAPKAAAERRMAPMLRGSLTWSSTRTRAGPLQHGLQGRRRAAGRRAGRRPDARRRGRAAGRGGRAPCARRRSPRAAAAWPAARPRPPRSARGGAGGAPGWRARRRRRGCRRARGAAGRRRSAAALLRPAGQLRPGMDARRATAGRRPPPCRLLPLAGPGRAALLVAAILAWTFRRWRSHAPSYSRAGAERHRLNRVDIRSRPGIPARFRATRPEGCPSG